MKAVLFAVGIVAAAGAWSSGAHAQNYPWCAEYGGRDGGGTNCGFTTFQQCQDTISGMGGFCNRNTQYVPPPGPHAAPIQRRRRHRNYPQP